MIPKIIHYCWFGGNPLPENVKGYIRTWKKYCPDYEIKQWDESNFDVSQNQYCREAYESKKWAFVSDYARLKVLYECGGIYMDTDIEMVKNPDSLLNYRAFSGFESSATISTGVIGSECGNEWIKYLLDDYNDRKFIQSNREYDLTTNVIRITRLTKEKYKVRMDNSRQIFGDNMVLFPFDYLCAKSYETGEIQKTDNTFTIHHFSGSWLSNQEKKYLQRIQSYRKQYSLCSSHKIGNLLIKSAAAYRTGGIAMVYQKICGKYIK